MTAARPEKWEAFGRLHEVTRAAILGFLSQPDVKLTQFSKANANIRRKLLEQMPPFDHTVGCLQGFIPQCA